MRKHSRNFNSRFQWSGYSVRTYALMISDLRMPGLNGLELLKKVKSANHIVRTILTNAYNYDEDELFQKYIKEGVIDSTIEKPVTLSRLCQS